MTKKYIKNNIHTPPNTRVKGVLLCPPSANLRYSTLRKTSTQDTGLILVSLLRKKKSRTKLRPPSTQIQPFVRSRNQRAFFKQIVRTMTFAIFFCFFFVASAMCTWGGRSRGRPPYTWYEYRTCLGPDKRPPPSRTSRPPRPGKWHSVRTCRPRTIGAPPCPICQRVEF